MGPATFDTLLIYGRRQKRRQHERPLRTRNAIRSSSTAKRLWHQPRVGSLVPWMELGEARQHTLLWQREVNSAFGPKQRKTVADSDRGSCNRQALRHSRGKNPRSDSKPQMALCRRWAYTKACGKVSSSAFTSRRRALTCKVGMSGQLRGELLSSTKSSTTEDWSGERRRALRLKPRSGQ